MNATALAMPPLPPALGLQHDAAAPPVARIGGLALLAATCVEQTAEALRWACRRGQLEDASAAARTAMPLAAAHSPHWAMLRVLAQAQPTLMVAPEERRIYLLRSADGTACGLMRLRESGRIGRVGPMDDMGDMGDMGRIDHLGRMGLGQAAETVRWALRDGDLELCDALGRVSSRFVLCGERAGLRLYLGEQLADGTPQLLQEVRCTFSRLSLLDPELADAFCGLYDADALVADDLPAKPALLLASPHSGADQLASVLNRHGEVFFDGEPLHPQAIHLAEGRLAPNLATTLHAIRQKDAPWFARMVLGRTVDSAGRDLSVVPVRGFTMAPAHHKGALDWAIAEPALRIVHLVRSNLLAEFADILQAQSSAPAGTASAGLHFEPERFARFTDMKQRYLSSVRSRLMQRNGDTVEVDSSRLNAATIAELMGFLTDTDPPRDGVVEAPAPRARRVIERFDNPEAVLHCLQATDRLGWAEIEGTVPDAP